MKKVLLLFTFSFSLFTFCSAQFITLHNFNDTAGKFPYAGVAISGNTLYGMTNVGDTAQQGVVYSVHTDGSNYTVLHIFTGGLDGGLPYGTLAVSGNTIYGMNFLGGGSFAYGVIFSMQTNGSNFTPLYAFNFGQGGLPYGSITLSGDTIFGMCTYGGANGDGIIFSVQTNGSNFTDLHDFDGTHGSAPYYNSLVAAGGMLYGMTPAGGAHGNGVVFSMQTNGNNFTDLHDFNNTQGAGPNGSLILSGNTLYGMTSGGGAHGYGIIFSIQTNGSAFTDMHEFDELHGAGPLGSLALLGSTLYGMTNSGGANASGTIFSVDIAGNNFTDLYDLRGVQGAWPQGSSFIISGSSLYATTAGGGKYYDGTVFKFAIPALAVNQLPASEQSVTVFPNPSNGVFSVQIANSQQLMPARAGSDGANSQMEVYNSLGQKVYAASLNPSKGGTSITNISLPFGETRGAGIYLYRVISTTGSLVGEGKLIIQ